MFAKCRDKITCPLYRKEFSFSCEQFEHGLRTWLYNNFGVSIAVYVKNKKLCYCRGTCDALVSRNPASHLKTVSCGNLRDSTFSRFDTIPECDRHTDRRKDTRRRPTALSIASRGKNRPYYTAHQLSHCRQRATVDSRMYSYYHIFER